MKRFIRLLAGLFLALAMVACGGKAETTTRTFTQTTNNVESTLVFTCDGDKVVKQTAKNVMKYDDFGLTDKDEAKELIEPQLEDYAKQYEGIDGVTYELDFQDDRVVENISVDYTVASLSDLKDIQGFTMDDNDGKADFVSMEKTSETLEAQGYEEVK